jgi:hypothetical protein
MAAEARFAQPANLWGLQLSAVCSQLPFELVDCPGDTYSTIGTSLLMC